MFLREYPQWLSSGGATVEAEMSDVTRILEAIEGGDAGVTDELLPLVYEELRLLAAQKLSCERPGQTLQATALVHEAYVRLVGDEPQNWNGSGHFFKAASEAMRRILIENARRKKRIKHGGNRCRVELEAVDYGLTHDFMDEFYDLDPEERQMVLDELACQPDLWDQEGEVMLFGEAH